MPVHRPAWAAGALHSPLLPDIDNAPISSSCPGSCQPPTAEIRTALVGRFDWTSPAKQALLSADK